MSKDKMESLERFREKTNEKGEQTILTTDHGVPVADNQNTLRAGKGGPALLEDFIMREKIMHFDHERIPERVVHARGSAAHGYFQVYKPLAEWTKAKFLQDPAVQTPVFVRFSTASGNRGSTDTPRDVRGFATKFYTEEGNYDLVGNNFPVFFVQDAIKFPDFFHAAKPEPDWEIPQASSAHDNFWDFITQQPETTHALMWLMSDRALPRSYSMMEGFGVNTFRLINAEGVSRFVKFHWKPVLGVHSLVWDEAQKISGKDPDFNRRGLWEEIESGNFPEFELGLQIVDEVDEFKFDFDLLDCSKLIPEELVPVQRVGRMILTRNVDNFFAETEQVAFCASHVVPGIDFTNDPILQGRLFSYLDTQLTRLGGPNFHEIPINRAVCPFKHNNQRDGFHRQTIFVGKTNYDINGINSGLPREGGPQMGFVSYPEKLSGEKIRKRSESFADHFSQATMFWRSMSPVEKEHIADAFSFELSRVKRDVIRERMVSQLLQVDFDLALHVGTNLGLKTTLVEPAVSKKTIVSLALSQLATAPIGVIKGRRIAVLAANGVDGDTLTAIMTPFTLKNATILIISPRVGVLYTASGDELKADGSITGNPSVMFDAVFIPGGAASIQALSSYGEAIHFVQEAFVHCKPIAAVGAGSDFLAQIGLLKRDQEVPEGVFVSMEDKVPDKLIQQFIDGIGQHRFFARKNIKEIPV